SMRLLRRYLGRPYSFFLNRHSADLSKAVLAEVSQLVSGVLLPLLHLVANTVVAAFLVTLVIAVEPAVALTAVVTLAGAYFLIYMMLRKYLEGIGADRLQANRERYQVAQEGLSGIKDVKVFGLEENYVRKFSKPAERYARLQASNQIAGELPRFVLEALAFGGIVVILLVLLVRKQGDVGAVFPLMAVYAFAGTRLMPALQHVYSGLSKLRFGLAGLNAIHADLAPVAKREQNEPLRGPAVIRVRDRLELRNVWY